MRSRRGLAIKHHETKEEAKRNEKLFFGQKRIDPAIYLSYYTLNSKSYHQREEANLFSTTLPNISITNSPMIIHTQRPRPEQKLVEDLLLSKKNFKNQKKIRFISHYKANLNKTTENVSKSVLLPKKIDLKHLSKSNFNKTQTNAQIVSKSFGKITKPLILNEKRHLTIATESTDTALLPKIAQTTPTNTALSQSTFREKSNSTNSMKSILGFSKKGSNSNISYKDFVSTYKNKKSSKFSHFKSPNEIDAYYDYHTVENKIISDFIGKTYETNSDDDGYSCFFTSTGNFNCPLLNVFGVVEGYGKDGKHIASLARSNLHTYLTSGITYGFMNCKVTESEVYEAINKNNYEPIRFVIERIDDDVQKSLIDIDNSGASITVVFIIKKKLICFNAGDVRAVAFLETKDKGKEILKSKQLSSLDMIVDENNNKVLTNGIGNRSKSFTENMSCYSTDITDDYMHLIIASTHFWDNMTYGNVFKYMSSIQTDNIICKAEQIIDFKKKQNELYNRKNMPYTFCLIEF